MGGTVGDSIHARMDDGQQDDAFWFWKMGLRVTFSASSSDLGGNNLTLDTLKDAAHITLKISPGR